MMTTAEGTVRMSNEGGILIKEKPSSTFMHFSALDTRLCTRQYSIFCSLYLKLLINN